MPKEISKLLAVDRLLHGAVGVGESHTKPQDARSFTKRLIECPNLVKALFIEHQSSDQGTIDEFVDKRDSPQLEATIGLVGPVASDYVNDLNRVVAAALRARVPVFCLDVNTKLLEDIGYSEKRIGKIEKKYGVRAIDNTSKPGMSIRDLYAANLFKKIVASKLQGGMKGCLVHYGAMHFTGVYRQAGKEDVQMHHKPGATLADHLLIDYVLFT